MSYENKLLRSLSSAQFAMWELHLYLNTHPEDMTAVSMYEKYKIKADEIKNTYEEKFGPLSPDSSEGIEWIKNPWPWERDGEDD